MIYWVAILLMIGGPADGPQVFSLSGPPTQSQEECEHNAREAGIGVFQRFYAPQGWQISGAYCIPVDEKFKFNIYSVPT